jgi:hypothetical protein
VPNLKVEFNFTTIISSFQLNFKVEQFNYSTWNSSFKLDRYDGMMQDIIIQKEDRKKLINHNTSNARLRTHSTLSRRSAISGPFGTVLTWIINSNEKKIFILVIQVTIVIECHQSLLMDLIQFVKRLFLFWLTNRKCPPLPFTFNN